MSVSDAKSSDLRPWWGSAASVMRLLEKWDMAQILGRLTIGPSPIGLHKLNKGVEFSNNSRTVSHPGAVSYPRADLHVEGRTARRVSRANADDRLSLDTLSRVEGGDCIVEGSHLADVCP